MKMYKSKTSPAYIHIPTVISITDVSSTFRLEIAKSFQSVEEVMVDKRKLIKTVCANIGQILPELDGVEVSETV